MALSDLTFKLYTDSGLSSSYSGTTNIINFTDLSDNPQQFTLYFGSASVVSRVLRAVSNPGTDQIVLTPTLTTPVWTLNTSYSLGQIVKPVSANGFIYICTTAGTSNSTEPTWPTTPIGQTVSDNTVVWTLYSVAHAVTEIKLATTQIGLASATAGAALNIGTSISNGSGNAITVWVQLTNAVQDVSNNTGYPELGIYINNVVETAA